MSQTLEAALRSLAVKTASIRWSTLSPTAQHAARRVFLDDLGAMLAGSLEEEPRLLRASWSAESPAHAATLLAPGFARVELLRACLHNGTCGAGPEIAEGYRFATVHAGIYTLPVVLALSEQRRASGSAALAAMVAGYEAAARCGVAFRLPPHVHPHGPWGLVGASVAAAHLVGGDADVLFRALTVGLALMPAAAWDVAMAGGSVRNTWTGFGALIAALVPSLEAAGYRAPLVGIEQALRQVLQTGWEPNALTRPPHEGSAIENNYHKRFSCVGFIPPVIEALEQALPQVPDTASSVISISVEVPGAAERLSNQQPDSVVAARFSIPYCVAVYLTTGTVAPASFSKANLEDKLIRDLCRRVTVVEGTDLPHPYSAQRSARVTVVLADGSQRRGYCRNARGDFSNPLSDQELKQKFARVTAAIFGSMSSDVANAAWDFQESQSVTAFIASLAEFERRHQGHCATGKGR